MALMHLNFSSSTLGGNTEISVLLPTLPGNCTPKDFYLSGKKYKVLWLLHGAFGDHTDWIRKTSIELYAAERDLIVVMPSGLNAGYANWPSFGPGYNMYDFLTKELMPLIYGWLPVSDKREDNYIAGLSMGGRGTCIYAFNYPELFAGAAVFSSVPRDIDWIRENEPAMFQRLLTSALINHGSFEAYEKSFENTWRIIGEKAKNKNLPKLFFTCGTEDSLYPSFLHFQKYAEKIGLPALFESVPGYRHEWPFWDISVLKALEYFEIPKRGKTQS